MTIFELAKHQLDIGFSTNRREEMLAFWRAQPGVVYEGPLSVGGGVQQHRHQCRGSIVKINHARNDLPSTPKTGYARVLIASPGLETVEADKDPEGTLVQRVPPGTDGITQLGVVVGVRDLAAHKKFWGEIIGLAPATRAGPDAFCVGDSVLFLEHDPAATPASTMEGPGFRYLTLQVWDADGVHADVLSRGGTEGRPPITHGAVARYSFVRDPDGNWIELSQRASLTGPVA